MPTLQAEMRDAWLLASCFVVLNWVVPVAEAESRTYEGYQEGNLTCIECYKSVHGEKCIKNPVGISLPLKRCRDKQYYCRVNSFYEAGELKTFTRECAEKCEEGCERVDTSIPFMFCNSCCREDLCNYQSARAGTRAPSIAVMALTAMLTVTLVWRCHVM